MNLLRSFSKPVPNSPEAFCQSRIAWVRPSGMNSLLARGDYAAAKRLRYTPVLFLTSHKFYCHTCAAVEAEWKLRRAGNPVEVRPDVFIQTDEGDLIYENGKPAEIYYRHNGPLGQFTIIMFERPRSAFNAEPDPVTPERVASVQDAKDSAKYRDSQGHNFRPVHGGYPNPTLKEAKGK